MALAFPVFSLPRERDVAFSEPRGNQQGGQVDAGEDILWSTTTALRKATDW